jgi:bifunctional DNase/RNase
MLHKVSIAGMTMDTASNTPVIVLKSEEDGQTLPIWIGLLEATAIASVLQHIRFERPMTHDLFKNFTDMLNFKVSKVEVCDLKDNTFYARIYFTSEDRTFSLDARPSDAIAIALRFGAPMYVDNDVMVKSKTDENIPGEAVDKSEEGKKWAEYLEKLSPEEFGKYKI